MPQLTGRILVDGVVAAALLAALVWVVVWAVASVRVRRLRARRGIRAQSVNATSDDFGLLAPAALVDSTVEARRIREVLTDAGIRATTAVDSKGRWRVLVFASELYRARRVSGWSP